MSIQTDRKEPLLSGSPSEDYAGIDDSAKARKAASLVRRKRLWMKKNVWSADDLRRLFRTLDNNGNGRLSYEEFRSGLSELGFESRDESAKALYRQMDHDGDGAIRESEFLKLFRNMNRDHLQKQLSTTIDKASPGIKGKPVNLKIVDFGFDDGKGQFQEFNFDESNIVEVMKVKPTTWKKRVRWIDIHGDAPEIIQLLANELDVPPFIVDEAGLKHSGKVQFYPEHQILEVVTHRTALENLPVRNMTAAELKAARDRAIAQHEENDQEEREHNKALILGKKYPAVHLRSAQVILFCFGDHTVLTVRRRSHVPEIANVFAEIASDIKSFAADVRSHLEVTSSREFLCSLLNEVNEQNWALKDHFKEWKVTLEKEIHLALVPGQSRHMLDLDRCANTAHGLLEPFVKSASKIFGLSEEEEDKEQSKGEEKKEKQALEQENKALSFVEKEKALYRDTSLSAQRLVESLKYTRDACGQLSEFYRHQNEERQNDTLKTLTVITSTVIPMQLSTGVFGMNFEHMPELPYEYSYLIFWLLNVFVILLILAFWRSRHFI